jgi:CDP-paratose 2-epimerase
MIPVDRHWLRLMQNHGALEDIDVVAIHAFPEMWWPNHPNWEWYDHWHGWKRKIDSIRGLVGDRPIWVTETGLATWDVDRETESREDLQILMLERAAGAPAERLYWYSLVDLSPEREAIEGFHVDENEYHMGLVRWDGTRKDAFFRFRELLANDGAASQTTGSAIVR